MSRRIIGLGLVLVASLVGLTPRAFATSEAGAETATRIGLVSSLFRDLSPALVQFAAQPLSALIREQTGLSGQAVVAGDPMKLGRMLADGQVHFGVFHGVEFAWAQEKYPELRPLVIAINRQRHLRACLVVRQDSDVKGFACLKGKRVALPRRSREHCHLFIERACLKRSTTPKDLFDEVVIHPDIEKALDDVLRGKVAAAVVDNVSLESYEALKPGCYARLKIAQQSPIFPAAVIAYRQGSLDDAILARFRAGLLRAHQNPRSRELMFAWRLTAFEPVPADYQQTLNNIRKAFPAPESPTSTGAQGD
ncbi:MAG: PhnD/SsuA/transferrin family substrate-binding protein [Gemmataceae bacterium]|nr:PhnD/SsuA/transferrin family substrate-binding protein [Gemmataceae bacterium]